MTTEYHRYYRIESEDGSRHLRAVESAREASLCLIDNVLEQTDEFLLLPHRDGGVAVVSRRSGLLLDVADWHRGPGGRVQLWPLTRGVESGNQRFDMIPLRSGVVGLRAAHSGKAITAKAGGPIHSVMCQGATSGDFLPLRLVPTGEVALDPEEFAVDAPQPLLNPRLADINTRPSDTTEPVVVYQQAIPRTALPEVLVELDAALLEPFVLFRQTQAYRLHEYHVYAKGDRSTTTFTQTVETREEVNQGYGVEGGAKAGAGVKWLAMTASVSLDVKGWRRVSNTLKAQEKSTLTREDTRDFKRRTAFASWLFEDRYEVLTLDGRRVLAHAVVPRVGQYVRDHVDEAGNHD